MDQHCKNNYQFYNRQEDLKNKYTISYGMLSSSLSSITVSINIQYTYLIRCFINRSKCKNQMFTKYKDVFKPN